MTFIDAVKFLESYIPSSEKKHPGELGLARMQYLMDLLGNPQITYPTIHVGGTSGKGSTATIIASILATKYKVGLHTSPHLEKITERIKILEPKLFSSFWQARNERAQNRFWTSQNDIKIDITDDDFISLTNQIFPTIKIVEKSKFGRPSYFEIVSAMAFLYFQKQKVDFAVVEVGMGGRYDATNVIKPLVAVLTKVGLDHTEVLGDTVEKIAKDKVGIIKPHINVVSGVRQHSIIKIVEDKCRLEQAALSLLMIPSPRGSPNMRATPEVSLSHFGYQVKMLTQEGSVFDYINMGRINNLKLSLLGEYQVENAALAIRAIEKLSNQLIIKSTNQLIKLGEEDIRKGLLSVFIPGRLEIVKKNPLVILDGAHNPEKMKALVKAISDIFPNKKITAILAIKSEKNARAMLLLLLPICKCVVLTKFRLTTDLGDTYSYDPEELLEIVKSRHPEFIPPKRDPVQPAVISGSSKDWIPDPFGFAQGRQVRDDNNVLIQPKSCMIVEKPIEALRIAQLISNSDDLILVTGSLYLVGEIRKRFSNYSNYHSNVHE